MCVHVCAHVFMCVLMGFQGFFVKQIHLEKNTYIGDIQPSFLICKQNKFQWTEWEKTWGSPAQAS